MEDYDPLTTFDEARAERYDERLRGDEEDTVAFLARLAGGGPAYELAIGTGRIALPLAARGVRVDGIDSSPAMVAKLRSKPGGEDLAVTVGDMSAVPLPVRYPLVYLVYNTLFNLLTQDEQVSVFEKVAAGLTEDGVFVVEAFTPDWLFRLRSHQYVDAEEVGAGHVWLDVARHDPVTQTLTESHVRLAPEGITVAPIVCRYAWPSELDLMARLAGLRLKARWAGWNNEPFEAESKRHVSVYGR